MNIAIRNAHIEDMETVFQLVYELAIYEKEPESVTTDAAYYREQFRNGLFQCIVAEVDKSIVGICIFYPSFSTWRGKMMYLEDFVITLDYRRKGIGDLLFDRFIAIAKEQQCTMVKWQVLDWNEPAIKFYKKKNAIIEDEWYNGKIIF